MTWFINPLGAVIVLLVEAPRRPHTAPTFFLELVLMSFGRIW